MGIFAVVSDEIRVNREYRYQRVRESIRQLESELGLED